MSSPLENRRVVDLSDAQLLECMRGRGNDLATLRALEFVTRMFDKAGESNRTARVGLSVATELVKLYGQNFAAGHELHPFKDFHGSVASIMQRASLLECEDAKPRPPRQKKTLVVDNGDRADRIREGLAAHAASLAPAPSLFVIPAALREPDPLRHPPLPRIEAPRFPVPPKLERAPKLPKIPRESKRQITADLILGLIGEFGIPAIYGEIAKKGLDQIQRTDVMNAIDMLRKKKKIVNAGHGRYVVAPAETQLA